MLLRRILILIGIVFVALAIAVFIFWMRLPNFAANVLSSKLKAPVSIEDINIKSERIDIQQLEIGNPKGFVMPKALSSNIIDIQAYWKNYLQKEIVIDRIDINDVYVGLEFPQEGNQSGNWTTIMNNIREGGDISKEKKKTSDRSVLIKELSLSNIDIELLYGSDISKVQKLSKINNITLTNVSSTEGIPMNQIINIILSEMLKKIFLDKGITNMLEGLQLPFGGEGGIAPLKPLQGLFNANENEEAPSRFCA